MAQMLHESAREISIKMTNLEKVLEYMVGSGVLNKERADFILQFKEKVQTANLMLLNLVQGNAEMYDCFVRALLYSDHADLAYDLLSKELSLMEIA